MSDLLKKYDESDSYNVEKAKLQSAGDDSVSVNHFDTQNVFSENFSTFSDNGSFTEFAKGYYVEEMKDIDSAYMKYNRDNKYAEKNSTLPGVINKSK